MNTRRPKTIKDSSLSSEDNILQFLAALVLVLHSYRSTHDWNLLLDCFFTQLLKYQEELGLDLSILCQNVSATKSWDIAVAFFSRFLLQCYSAQAANTWKKRKYIATHFTTFNPDFIPLLPGMLCNLVGQLTDPFRAPLASMAKVSCLVKSSKTFFVGEVGGKILRVGSPLSTYKLIFMNTFKGRLQEIQTLSDMKHIFSGSSGDKNLIKYLVLPRRFSSTQTPTAGGHFPPRESDWYCSAGSSWLFHFGAMPSPLEPQQMNRHHPCPRHYLILSIKE